MILILLITLMSGTLYILVSDFGWDMIIISWGISALIMAILCILPREIIEIERGLDRDRKLVSELKLKIL